MNSPLKFEKVAYSYRRAPVVRDLSFEIAPNDITTVIGPNGSGKTTLVKLALGILTPSAGEVTLLGQSATKFRNWSRVGYVPQTVGDNHTELFPGTVAEMVSKRVGRFVFSRSARSATKRAVSGALARSGVDRLSSELFTDLSPGLQQRVLLARALVLKPELLILDEPTASVDTIGRDDFSCTIEEIRSELDVTIVWVSHDTGIMQSHDYACLCVNCELVYNGRSGDIDNNLIERLYHHPAGDLRHRRG